MVPALPPVVDQAWLRQHPYAVVADVRSYLDGRSGRAAWEAGHLPGAVFVDLETVLAAPPERSRGRHPLPEPEVFAEGMAAAGISASSTVVAYDDAGGVMAARLVWLLRAVGVDAALLDGGLTAWTGPLTVEAPRPGRGDFPVRPWPADRLADLDDVTGDGAVVLDARDAARFRGEVEPVDPVAGHVPGARSLPCRENLDGSGRFLPVDELRERFAAVGVSAGTPVIAYCGSGVTACHDLLALEHAGLGEGRLYPGSWSQYCATGLPVATGA